MPSIVTLRNLRISTNVRLHPDFFQDPSIFARRNRVALAGDVNPETSFKKEPDSDQKAATIKANIHLVKFGAINLFTERVEDGDRVRSISLNPALLLNSAEGHSLTENDLLASLSLLRTKVAPLLADPTDVCNIVPGLSGYEDSIAYWSVINMEALFPNILIPCFHDLNHPSTGPAEGATTKRIQFGNKKDDCVIRMTKACWEVAGSGGMKEVQGVRVRLILKGLELAAQFKHFGTTALVKKFNRLVAFPTSALARVHQTILSQLEGTYLPVPPEWADKSVGKPVTHAKAIALFSQLTTIPMENIRAIDEEIRHPSQSTRTRLNRDLQVEAARLMPVPVSTLFEPVAYAGQALERAPQLAGGIDPQVAAVYGEG